MHMEERKKQLEKLFLVNTISEEEYQEKLQELKLEEDNLKKAKDLKSKKRKIIIAIFVALIIIWIIIRTILMMKMISNR